MGFLCSVFMPEDEICLFVYEGATDEAVREAVSRAELGAWARPADDLGGGGEAATTNANDALYWGVDDIHFEYPDPRFALLRLKTGTNVAGREGWVATAGFNQPVNSGLWGVQAYAFCST